jgi:hypothetical protein
MYELPLEKYDPIRGLYFEFLIHYYLSQNDFSAILVKVNGLTNP